jgi:hypothetical protein
MEDFNPDAYLKEGKSKESFNPDSYLAETTVKKKDATTPASPEATTSGSKPASEQPLKNGAEVSWFDKAKNFIGQIGENIQSGYGIGAVSGNEQDIQAQIEAIQSKKVEPQQVGVDMYGNPMIKKVPYKTYKDMYDATLNASLKYNEGRTMLTNLDGEIKSEVEKIRAKKGFKMTGKDAEGNEIYEMNPMESFMNGVGNTMQTIDIGLHNLTGDKKNAVRLSKQKFVEDNVLFPKTTGDGVMGTIAKGTEMVGGVTPLMVAAPVGGLGAIAMNSLLFGVSDYGGTLYGSYLEEKQGNPDMSDEEAMTNAQSNARFAGAKGLVLGATLPAQGALGEKIFLSNAERGAFKKFLAGQTVMIPAFGSSTALQNWYEDKPITDNVGKSMVDAFIVGGMLHGLHVLPTMPAKIKSTFENGVAKNYGSLAPVIDKAVADGMLDYSTGQKIAEKAKAYDVVGVDAPEKAVDKGIELNNIASEIAKRKEANPLADVKDLEVRAEELNKQIHEIKGTALSEKESKEYDALKAKDKDSEQKLTATEKNKLAHYDERISESKRVSGVDKLVDKLSSGEKVETTPEEQQLYENNKKEIEDKLKQKATINDKETPQAGSVVGGEVVKRIIEPTKPISEMNSEEMGDFATETRRALKKQDKEFDGKSEKEKEDGGYYDIIDEVEDLRDASERINFIENAENISDLASSTESVLRNFNKDNPSEYSLAILNAVKKKSTELNIQTEDLVKAVVKKVGNRYQDASDAETMIRAYLEKIIPPKQSLKETTKAETVAETKVEPNIFEKIEEAKRSKKSAKEKQNAAREAVKDMGEVGEKAIFVDENFNDIKQKLSDLIKQGTITNLKIEC